MGLVYPCYSSRQKKEILYILLIISCALFSRSYPNFIRLKDKHAVWVRTASIIPKRDSELMTLCYLWVREMLILAKWNICSLIYCHVWVRQMPIVPKPHVYPNFIIGTNVLKLRLHLKHTESLLSQYTRFLK